MTVTHRCDHEAITPSQYDDWFRCLDCRELLHRREVRRG